MNNKENTNLKVMDTEENEIDLVIIYRILKRNKSFIFNFSISILIISCIFSLIKRRVWEGQFEIVISQNNNNQQLSNNQLLQNFINLDLLNNSNSQTLNTEVGILKSPSVLMPIFNFVNNEKSNFKKGSKVLNFSTWQNKNLKIDLRKRTSILNITYRDTNKEIIIPVLEKISSTYQNYSGLQNKRNFEITKNFLNTQISLYRKKSSISKKVALEYAEEQNLSINDIQTQPNLGFNDAIKKLSLQSFGSQLALEKFNFDQNTPNNTNLESIRVNATNEINKIDYQINKLENITAVKDLQYIGSTLSALVEQGLPQTLEKIESQLIELRAKYQENDISIKRLLDKRDRYAKLLKERSLGYLRAKRIAYEAKLESVKRPKGVIIKGKELMREANRDEKTLVTLENNLRNLELLESRQEDPWKLITKPTIKEFPVAPNRRKFATLGLIFGLTLSSALAYFRERLSGTIYEEKDLENLFSIPILTRLDLKETLNEKTSSQLKLNELEKIFSNNLNFVYLYSEKDYKIDEYKNLKKSLYRIFTNKINLISCSEVINKENLSNNSAIIITSLGKLNFSDAKSFKNRSKILNINIDGIILIN